MVLGVLHTPAHTHTCRDEKYTDGGGVREKQNRKRENRNGEERLINPPFSGVLKTFDSAAPPLPTCLLLCEVV